MVGAEPTDVEVIEESVRAPDKFHLIWERHFDAVFRFAVRRVGRATARDVVAETFTRAFERRAIFEALYESCLPWLYGIARNVIMEELRRSASGPRSYLVPGSLDDDSFEEAAENRVVAQSVRVELEEALGRLSGDDRETLLMFSLERLTYPEIAAALGIPQGTVGSRINRSRRILLERIPDLEHKTRVMTGRDQREAPEAHA